MATDMGAPAIGTASPGEQTFRDALGLKCPGWVDKNAAAHAEQKKQAEREESDKKALRRVLPSHYIKDEKGKTYIDPERDWSSYLKTGEDVQTWNRAHGFYHKCEPCRALNKECDGDATGGCKDCRELGIDCEWAIATPAHREKCREGVLCTVMHLPYMLTMDALGIDPLKFPQWKWPAFLNKLEDTRSEPMAEGAAQQFHQQHNPGGYKGAYARPWVVERFNPKMWDL